MTAGYYTPPDPGPELPETHRCIFCMGDFTDEQGRNTPFGFICNKELTEIDLNLSECCRAPFIAGSTRCSECCGQTGPYVLTQAEINIKQNLSKLNHGTKNNEKCIGLKS
jgi:hypothetical protein